MKNRIPRKLKKKYKSNGMVYCRKYGILLIVDSGKPTRSVSFNSKYMSGTEAYMNPDFLNVYGR